MLILGLDFETTGKNVNRDNIVEIGAVLWDTVRNSPVQIYSEMLWYEEIWNGATATPETIEQITKISSEDLIKYGISPKDGLSKLKQIMSTTDLAAAVAHNGNEFDKPLLLANAKRWDIELPEISWIDTMTDIPYEPHIQTRKLTHLASDHGFVNPFAHRAIFDVLTMLKVLQNYDIEWLIKLSKEPSVTLIANTTPPWEDGGKSNEEAKSRGFRFNSENKKWVKSVKESQVQLEKSLATFSIREIR